MSEGLTDKVLAHALAEIRSGLINAKLGGNLVKKRIAIGNKGRAVVCARLLFIKHRAKMLFACICLQKRNLKI
jgi:hypothetical protein